MTETTLNPIEFWESFTIIVSLVIGGAWAVYTFFSRLQAALEVRILTTQLRTSSNGAKGLIQVLVEIENMGTRNTRLEWKDDDPPFRVFSVTQIDKDINHAEVHKASIRKSRNPSQLAKATVIRAGTTERIPFLVELDAGVYLLSFAAQLPEKDQRQSHKSGTPLNRPTVWAGRQHIVVPPNDPQ